MTTRPDVRYAENDGVSLAYMRWGAGDRVVVYTPPWVSNVELSWDIEEYVRTAVHAAAFHEVVSIDKRGVGLSDRTDEAPTLEQRVADTLAVIRAEGLSSVVIGGMSEGAAIAIAIAARHPELVEKLIVLGAAVPGVPWSAFESHVAAGDPPPPGMRPLRDIIESWGRPDSRSVEYFMPSCVGDDRVEEFFRRFERQSASPRSLRLHFESAMATDISADLPGVRCPTFIGHSRGDRVVPVATSRYLAARIPHAELRIWDDPNHVWQFSPKWREMQDDVIAFVEGVRPPTETTTTFGVVLFTDIVRSTERATEMGDEAWARLIRAHDAAADPIVGDHGGRRVKSTGDGLLAVFTDPERAVRAAHRLRAELAGLGVDIRAGVHAGQVELQGDGDITGIAVHIAARVEATAPTGEVCVSSTVRDLLIGASIDFDSIGRRSLKGIDHPVDIYTTRC